MALGIFKKAWNSKQLSDLTNYFTSYLTSVLSNYITTAVFNQALANVILFFIEKARDSNTASGVSTATINGKSGVIEYSGAISANDYRLFQFTNSSVNSSSIILFSIESPSTGTGGSGLPYVQSYTIASPTVSVIIANSDSVNATNQNLFLNFLIVN
jgi:hypothetical protein